MKRIKKWLRETELDLILFAGTMTIFFGLFIMACATFVVMQLKNYGIIG